MIENYKDWATKVAFTLSGYLTSMRLSMGAAPFSLVLGMEVALQIKMKIASLRVALEGQVLKLIGHKSDMHDYWALMRKYYNPYIACQNSSKQCKGHSFQKFFVSTL